ncbi:MAG: hypothetical protein M1837_003249 [Sclerophora amabilis]|nr:MAG: hypothetical protein M1837_003249 [Sclerophora amabilis]
MECMRDTFVEGVLLDGRFKTLSPLNHGSFGLVFMAKDMETGELVAIKCLTKLSAANACPVSLIVDDRSEELACHTRLGSHRNIVNLIHHFESETHTYLVLEFCSMGDLYEAIRLGRGPLKTDHVQEFMLQLVDAVEFMHAKGIYHRDIKPENIFLTQSGDMKLGDFGLATTEPWTKESAVGSDRYMSPEQYDSAGVGYAPDKADIWAIGVCLLNILFSRNPFVSPTESDPLFADFARDRQSLFDVFPNMSQDTFEVLLNSMTLDPEKRSLDAVREALLRVVSFTTDDETLDDFCTEDRDVVAASANREPLRTPSIQSPHVDQGGAFPWAKALHASPPQPIRQLSAIADTEQYPDDVPSGSVASHDDWFSAAGTPSVASVLDSGLGTSLKSWAIRRPERGPALQRSDPVPITGSMPIATGRPGAMASVFGKKDALVSKSWSDLWDEDEEAEEIEAESEAERHRASLRERTPVVQPATPPTTVNGDRKGDDKILRPNPLAQPTSLAVNTPAGSPGSGRRGTFKDVLDGGADENDTFFFEDHDPPRYSPPPRYTPPSRRDIMDKWAALGNRRRAYNAAHAPMESRHYVSDVKGARPGAGLGVSHHPGGIWDRKDKDKVKIWEDNEPHDDIGDLEWVGGWHDLHL